MIALVALAAGWFACAQPFIHDGDNIRCAGRTMRLARIDAPDFPTSPKCRRKRRAWCDLDAARRSRANLEDEVRAGPIHCRIVDANPFKKGVQRTDPYGRPVVICRGRHGDLSTLQLRTYNAIDWPAI